MTDHGVCNSINKTGATSRAGSTYLPEHLSSLPVFGGVRVTRSALRKLNTEPSIGASHQVSVHLD